MKSRRTSAICTAAQEKIGENLNPVQWIPYTDRMDYLAAMNMNLGMALAVEKLIKMEVPEKAVTLRVIIAEMNRIASHLVGMGAYGLDLGTFSPFLYAFREREIILDLFEEACGARLTYSYLTIGGATHDLPEQIIIPPGLAALIGESPKKRLLWTEAVLIFLDWLEKRVVEYHALLTNNAIFIKRTAGLGVLTREDAIDFGCTGPVLRGSGVDHDLRRDGEPIYTRMYEGYNFKIPVAPFADAPPEVIVGDNWCRFYVRMVELVESIGIVRQAIARYPKTEGTYRVPHKMNTKLPKDECYLETECPRGQMGFYIVGDGNAEPYRAARKARPSAISRSQVSCVRARSSPTSPPSWDRWTWSWAKSTAELSSFAQQAFDLSRSERRQWAFASEPPAIP